MNTAMRTAVLACLSLAFFGCQTPQEKPSGLIFTSTPGLGKPRMVIVNEACRNV